MQVFHQLDDVPSELGSSIVSVGNFDGVHRAHAQVLGEIVRRARESSAKAVAVTFDPHPARILRPDSGLKLLTPLPEKLRLLDASLWPRSFAADASAIRGTHIEEKAAGPRSA
jgi:riboflavin kinase/FMN adenylyltransferase